MKDRAEAAKHAPKHRQPRARVEQGAGTGFDTELGEEAFVRIRNDGERQIACVRQRAAAVEWNTTTSRIDAARMSSYRRTIE